ncbi:helix-turn-helix domain-containing protein [Rhizorhabdus phycosphaerae]|uniref:helix-turn-helix domain-containing protein n=1 Tax=Rhizorhabdus phycosphaerae TaxID=2711156 RepID=UPI0013ED9937|nr:short-chain fatty acyl-CoA regulator family protein [Rhizorhabdus phycosphaerae]
MAKQGIFAGPRVRRLRRDQHLTQQVMAEMLGISDSYLALIEGNRRPLTAGLILRLAELFDFDVRSLSQEEPGGGSAAMRRRLADPLFADISIDRAELEAWMDNAPGAAEAFARLFDRWREGGGAMAEAGPGPVARVRREIERWRNHFADLDAEAEALADELRMGAGDLYGAITERLRVRHQLAIRILPFDVMPDRLRRLDLHARQLQLSEMLDPAARTFQAAFQLAQIEAKAGIEALVSGAAFGDRPAERLYRRHVTSYVAAALMMPYGRFLRACETSGYDTQILQRRFGAGYEQVAHRLTTLQRVGARGLPFFMLRIDRAGQMSKGYAGASGAALVDAVHRCPLWIIHHAFDQPGRLLHQLAELEDGSRWFTVARSVRHHGGAAGVPAAEHVVALGLAAEHAPSLAIARGIDLTGPAERIGLGCAHCQRAECVQRAAPPAGRAVTINERERGLAPFSFVGD